MIIDFGTRLTKYIFTQYMLLLCAYSLNYRFNACLCSEHMGQVTNNLWSAGNELSVASFSWARPLEEVCVYLCVCVRIVLL